jgi:hypothetical protein
LGRRTHHPWRMKACPRIRASGETLDSARSHDH